MTTSQHYCADIVKQSGSNFAASFFFLKSDQRRAMRAVYAFSRMVDDIVDADQPDEAKRHQIDQWRLWLGHLATADHPIAVEMIWAINRFGIPLSYFVDLLEGVARDIGQLVIDTYDDLDDYCYGVASVVGLLCLPIFGVREGNGNREAAIALGRAFQYTNIIRDVAEDADRGRVYLPLDELARHGVTRHDVLAKKMTPGLRRLLGEMGDRAERYYTEAHRGFDRRSRRKLISVMMMSVMYRDILKQICANDYEVFGPRVRLSRWRKMWLVGKVLLGG